MWSFIPVTDPGDGSSGRLGIKASLPAGRSLGLRICSYLSGTEESMNWLIFRNKQASRKPSLLLVLWWKQKHDKRILAHLSSRKLFLYQDTINDGAFGSTGTVFDPLLQKTITAINGRCNRETSRWMCRPQETKGAGHSYRSWFWVTKGKYCKIQTLRLTNKDDRRNKGHLLLDKSGVLLALPSLLRAIVGQCRNTTGSRTSSTDLSLCYCRHLVAVFQTFTSRLALQGIFAHLPLCFKNDLRLLF